ncbi:class II aldolase/adducin family protein [Cohnella lubricantis]|uniref:Class II aldolase/adducin family protein n=1 Tax=Cohnella lubricantis TaxID=2163172 RepID=A0A841TE09_9BACL|nr:class II aldolase/adducin family protein [Cohnella lubricantis]MBB6677470.1 class II aldolase/adducin family protein [Cohnella lubricantis]MBP2116644.1 L-fuculose-phosphate aldolase [Cohnella lubricantis]
MQDQEVVKEDVIKQDVLADMTYASKILYLEGHNDINNGQISYRSGAEEIWIRKAFLGWEETTEDDYILIDRDGSRLQRDGIIPAEWPLHTEIYKRRQDVRCIIHSHPPYAMVFGATDLTLRPITHDAVPIMNTARFDLTTNTVTHPKIGTEVAEALGTCNTLLLKNHGIVSVGRTVPEAVCWALALENACKLQLLAESTGVPYSWTNDTEAKLKKKIIFGAAAVREYWAYWCRKADRHFGTGLRSRA